MSTYTLDTNIQTHDPAMLIDEYSSTDYYIGVSQNTGDPSSSNWQIKRIWQVGSVWHFGYPNASQDFEFIWDQRLNYVYAL
jgi:hypothetical protein